jgi:hemerythrin-like domain-containing protein
MSNVVQALRREHSSMTKLLDALERQIAEFDRGARPDYDIVAGVIDYCLTYPDLYHHPKEDLVFAKLQARDPAAAEAIGDLRGEHESLAETTRRLAATLRQVLNEAEMPRDSVHAAAAKFIGFYRKHIEMEETRFFPAALMALTEADWAEIEGRLSERQDPLFGRAPEARFAVLRQDILDWEQEDRTRP